MWGRPLGKQLNLYGNPNALNIPQCTHVIPPYSSWFSSGVLITSQCTQDIPHTHHGIPHVLMVLPMYSWYCPSVLNDIPWCPEHPPVYCTPPGVLHRHYAGACEQTLMEAILCSSELHFQQIYVQSIKQITI